MSPDRETPSDIEELLPWHAAGTLSRRDAQRVEEALAKDPALARRYALVREELSETILLNETLGAPSPRAMENLFAKIDAGPPRPVSARAYPNSSPACRRAHWPGRRALPCSRSCCRPD
jgi:anti-sigma factor RsiW